MWRRDVTRGGGDERRGSERSGPMVTLYQVQVERVFQMETLYPIETLYQVESFTHINYRQRANLTAM